jgi:hypothetical protein
MAAMDLEQGRPELYSTRTRSAWKLPAVALALVIVGLVTVTRLGGPDAPLPTAPPTAIAVAPTPTAMPVPTPRQITISTLAGVMSRSADGLSYADGIPTGISGQPVYRVRDALLVPVGRTMLVGGWYRSLPCRMTGRGTPLCPIPTISDVPLVTGQGDVRTDFIALDSHLVTTGAHVVLATVEDDPDCAIHAAGLCQPRLKVLQQIWDGWTVVILAD